MNSIMAKKKVDTENIENTVTRTKIFSPEYTGFLDEAPKEVIDKLEARKIEMQQKFKQKQEVKTPDVSE